MHEFAARLITKETLFVIGYALSCIIINDMMCERIIPCLSRVCCRGINYGNFKPMQ